MKKRIAIVLLAAAMLMLAACGSKAVTAPATEAQQETQPTETTAQPTETTVPAAPLEYAGVYTRTWSDEIGGSVVENHAYIVLNADHTGNWILQEIGTVTWDESQMTDNLGLTYPIALTQENGAVKLLVYEFPENPSVYEKIEKLPAEMEAMIAG